MRYSVLTISQEEDFLKGIETQVEAAFGRFRVD